MRGYFLVYRGWRDNPVFAGEKFSRADAWLWLIEHAAWKPTKAKIDGKIVKLKRGQLSYSTRYLANAWGWSRSNVNRTILRFKSETMIETSGGTRQMVITICNYDKYQIDPQTVGQQSGQHLGRSWDSDRDDVGTNKNEGNESNEGNGGAIAPMQTELLEIPIGLLRPPNGDWSVLLFRQCLQWLAGVYNEPPSKFRGLVGRWLKDCGDDAQRLVKIMAECQRDNRADPKAWIQAVIKRRVSYSDETLPGLEKINGQWCSKFTKIPVTQEEIDMARAKARAKKAPATTRAAGAS